MSRVERERLALAEDYKFVTGDHPVHFFCPILGRDEHSNLCMGHVVPKRIPNCSRAVVLQRADVDNFYGAVAEEDLCVLESIRAEGKNAVELIFEKKYRKLNPTVVADGRRLPHYLPNRGTATSDTRIVLTSPAGAKLEVAVRSCPEIERAFEKRTVRVYVGIDCPMSGIAAMLKAAHLTLFRMMGYSYGVTVGAMFVGKTVLGDFFLQNRDGSVAEAQGALLEYFPQFRNTIRPVYGMPPSRGTIDDGVVLHLKASSGYTFARGVFVRFATSTYLVFLPGDDTAVGTYFEFLRAPPDSLATSLAQFDSDTLTWVEIADSATRMQWPHC